MPDQPKMKAYIVSVLLGEPGQARLLHNAISALNSETAVAAVVCEAMTAGHAGPLGGVLVMELTEEWLRAALNGGQGSVVPLSVVPKPDPHEFTQTQIISAPDEPLPPAG